VHSDSEDVIFTELSRLSGLKRIVMASQSVYVNTEIVREAMVENMKTNINGTRNAEQVLMKVVDSGELHGLGMDWRDFPSSLRPRP
jgi:hypothetical protein